MTIKEKILRMIERLPDDVTYDRVMYHLDVMKHIELGLDDLEKGRLIDHDELFDRLLREDTKNQNRMDRAGGTKSARNPKVHQKRGNAKNSGRLHTAPAKRRSKT
jgi:hypothetical protein